ncbi:glutamate--tRNA ligase [Candidatus Gracilibacteria bacterium]|nr:glutamate--tRNA ligase [Candidatus Gracilibacteria bacterium]
MFTEVVVRMPPSPTGKLHLGTARTALFNYLFAKHYKGQIIFRWEDTDLERSKKEFETEILDGLKWLGMDFIVESSQVFRQSENAKLHHEWLEKLWQENKVFPCFVTPEEIEALRKKATSSHTNFVFWSPYRDESREKLEEKMKSEASFVWRIRSPKNEEIVFGDLIRGRVSVNSDTIGDFVVARSNGSVLYLLANVLDDWTQKVTHVLRGEDHISNTPKQILLYKALGAAEPYFGHIPLVLDNQKRKLSKRNADPDTCVLISDFIKQGFVPEAVINGLALLGWNPKSTEEIFSLADLIEIFDLQNVNPGAAQYNFEKMKWFNTHWIRNLPLEKLITHFNEFSGEKFDPKKDTVMFGFIREKVRSLAEIPTHLEYLTKNPGTDPEKLVSEKMQIDIPLAKKILTDIEKMLAGLDEKNWHTEKMRELSTKEIERLGVKNGQFFSPFRIALSNREVSVGPLEIAEILGKKETLQRLQEVNQKLS